MEEETDAFLTQKWDKTITVILINFQSINNGNGKMYRWSGHGQDHIDAGWNELHLRQ